MDTATAPTWDRVDEAEFESLDEDLVAMLREGLCPVCHYDLDDDGYCEVCGATLGRV
jgi:hypothetical protein